MLKNKIVSICTPDTYEVKIHDLQTKVQTLNSFALRVQKKVTKLEEKSKTLLGFPNTMTDYLGKKRDIVLLAAKTEDAFSVPGKLKDLQKLKEELTADINELINALSCFYINNIGDPWGESTMPLQTKGFERDVVKFFGDLYGIKEDEVWGYVTSGSTEAITAGINQAVRKYPEGQVYCSKKSTHYCLKKILTAKGKSAHKVLTHPNGRIDIDALIKKIKETPEVPPIIYANIGAFITGSIDDVAEIKRRLAEEGITAYYLHCDMALFGAMLPFIDGAMLPTFDSASISMHKFFGHRGMSGLFLTKGDLASGDTPEYTASRDSTVSGSRDGHAPVEILAILTMLGKEGIRGEVSRCLENTRYLANKLTEKGVVFEFNKNSNIIVMDAPSDKLRKKWALPKEKGKTHIVIMPHVTAEMLDEFMAGLCEEAFC